MLHTIWFVSVVIVFYGIAVEGELDTLIGATPRDEGIEHIFKLGLILVPVINTLLAAVFAVKWIYMLVTDVSI